MNLAHAAFAAACLILCSLIIDGEVKAQAPPSGRSYFPRRSFDMPFSLPRDTSNVREVKLYIKPELGGDWKLQATALPSDTRYDSRTDAQGGTFKVLVDADGAYDLSIMTVYTDGHSEPPSLDQLRSGARVTVDTRRPDIVLKPSSNPYPDGRVEVGIEWKIEDENLAPESIRLEGRWYGSVQWSNFARGFTAEATGRQAWTLQPNQRLEVRITASDRAGNQAYRSVVLGAGVAMTTSGGPLYGSGSSSHDQGYSSNPPNFRMINRRQVVLQFRMRGDLPQSRLDHIELWYTRVGNDWKKIDQKYDPPKDGEGPANIQYDVPEDGTYGFTMIAYSRAGIASQSPPQSNDPPQIWVEVDTIKPEAELKTVRLAQPNDPRTLVLEWKASDKNLTPSPIAFEYAEVDQNNPNSALKWQELTAPGMLPNTGRYVCATPQLSTGVYEFKVRMTVFDKAGNSNTVEFKNPINIDVTKPQIEILDVRVPTDSKRP
jgi:hypothetical protein